MDKDGKIMHRFFDITIKVTDDLEIERIPLYNENIAVNAPGYQENVKIYPGGKTIALKLRFKKISSAPPIVINSFTFSRINHPVNYLSQSLAGATLKVAGYMDFKGEIIDPRRDYDNWWDGSPFKIKFEEQGLLHPLVKLISKGDKANLSVEIDMDSFYNNEKFHIELSNADDISGLTGKIRANLPLKGPEIYVLPVNIARIEQSDALLQRTAAVGSNEVSLLNFKITAPQSENRVMVRKIIIKNTGTANVIDLNDLGSQTTTFKLINGSIYAPLKASIDANLNQIIFEVTPDPYHSIAVMNFGANRVNPLILKVVANIPYSFYSSLIGKTMRLSVNSQDVVVDSPDRIVGSVQGDAVTFTGR